MSVSTLHPATVTRFEFQAEIRYLQEMRDRFVGFLSSLEVEDTDKQLWMLIFSEALANAIMHGSGNDPAKKVILEWWHTDSEICLAVTDSGKGPPEEKTLDPKLPDDPLAEHGRGLMMIREMSSRWEHWRGPSGYRLVVGKSFTPASFQQTPPPSAEVERLLEELSACYESLSAFYRLGSNLLTAGNVGEFIRDSLEDLSRASGFSKVFIIHQTDLPVGVLNALQNIEGIRSPSAKDAAFLVEACGSGTFTWDAPEIIEGASLLRELGSGACVPINALERNWGWLAAGQAESGFTPQTALLGNLSSFSDIFGISLANAFLQEIRERELQTRREMELAAEIQRNLLPIVEPPQSAAGQIFLKQKSARDVSGDFAEACLDSEGRMVVTLIDVMGKGVPAATLGAIFRTAFHLHLKLDLPLAELANSINQTLCRLLGDMTLFVTAAFLRISKDGRIVELANCGHCPTLLYDNLGRVREFGPSGPPLGIFSDYEYEAETIILNGGETAAMVTDGCYEWDLPNGEQYGWERLKEFIAARRTCPLNELWHELLATVATDDSGSYRDDLTVVLWHAPSS